MESIALQLDFETTAGLRNALKRYTGRGARAVRAAGGLSYVLAQFNAACRPRRRARAARADVAVARADPDAAESPARPPAPPHADGPTPTRGRRSGLAGAAAQVLAWLGVYGLNLLGLDDRCWMLL